MNLEVQ